MSPLSRIRILVIINYINSYRKVGKLLYKRRAIYH